MMHTRIFTLFLIAISALRCKDQTSTSVTLVDTTKAQSVPQLFPVALYKADTLTAAEKSFLTRLRKESDVIIWTDSVARYYDARSNLLTSRLLLPESLLVEKGYFSFDLTAIGKITDAHITYNFSEGQANTGYGSIIGEDSSNYVHTMRSFGVTACVVEVYQNGKKILEKWKDR